MSENSNGEVLGAATALPATSALSVFLLNKVHPILVASFVVLNAVALGALMARLSRYFINRK